MSSTRTSLIPCIYYECPKAFKMKGKWKEHILKCHIDPERFWCKACNNGFDRVKDARNHCRLCSNNENEYRRCRDPERWYYASEHYEECFKNPHELADFLACSFNESGVFEASMDFTRKLKCLLGQSAYRETVTCISRWHLGAPEAWKDLIWDMDVARKLSIQLERGLKCSDASEQHAAFEFLEILILDGQRHKESFHATPYIGPVPSALRAFVTDPRSVELSNTNANPIAWSASQNAADVGISFTYSNNQHEQTTVPLATRSMQAIEQPSHYSSPMQQYSPHNPAQCATNSPQPNYPGAFQVENPGFGPDNAMVCPGYWQAPHDFMLEREPSVQSTSYDWDEDYVGLLELSQSMSNPSAHLTPDSNTAQGEDYHYGLS